MLPRVAVSGLAVLVAACALSTEGTAPSDATAATGASSGTGGESGVVGSTSSTQSASSVSSSGTAAEGGATSTGGDGGATSTGGATSAGGSGGATGGGGTGGEGGVFVPPEVDCLDGLDDNEDGLIDCEDPSCTGYTCVPVVAEALYYLTLSDDPCVTDTVDRDGMACGNCTCTRLPGVCTVNWEARDSGDCSGQPFASGTTCMDNSSQRLWISGEATHDGMQSCTAPNPVVGIEPVEACQTSKAGQCGDVGLRCVPEQGTTHCVALPAATAPCPPEYPERAPVTHERNLSGSCDCTCTGGTPTCDGGQIRVALSNACPIGGGSNASLIPADGACNNIDSVNAIEGVNPQTTYACDATLVPQDAPAEILLCCQELP